MTKSEKTNHGLENTDRPGYSNYDAPEHTLITKHNVWRVKCVQIPVKERKPKPTDNKIATPLQPTNIKTRKKWHTQEQIEALIGHLVQDKMSIWKASKKVKISVPVCKRYYQKYINDHKIPAPNSVTKHRRCFQHQVNKLIDHIVHDKMEIEEAAERADLGIGIAKHYYGQYLNDPNHQVPIAVTTFTRYSEEQVQKVLDFIVNQGMSINEASKRGNMHTTAVRSYYHKYLNGSLRKMPQCRKFVTQEQLNQLIHHYNTNGSSIGDAARKVNMRYDTAVKYIAKYQTDPMHKVPLAGEKARLIRTKYTYKQIEQMIHCVTDMGMFVYEAAKESNVHPTTAMRYWKMYINDPYHRIPLPGYSTQSIKFADYLTAKRVKEFIDCVFKSNMSLKEASDQTKIPGPLAMRYYHFYIKDPERKIPVPSLPAKH